MSIAYVCQKFRLKVAPLIPLSTRLVFQLFLLVLAGLACQRKNKTEDPGIWKKIRLDFRQIDAQGLAGPSGGKVAVNYEFCLPANESYWKKVRKIDASAQKYAGSAGRSGCGTGQWLIVGATNQPKYMRVLYELASLPYVEKIEQTFWE